MIHLQQDVFNDSRLAMPKAENSTMVATPKRSRQWGNQAPIQPSVWLTPSTWPNVDWKTHDECFWDCGQKISMAQALQVGLKRLLIGMLLSGELHANVEPLVMRQISRPTFRPNCTVLRRKHYATCASIRAPP